MPFTLINNNDHEIQASVAFDGDLKGYITLPQKTFTLKQGEQKAINATAHFPRSFQDTKKNVLLIIASEDLKDTAQISARTHSVIQRTFILEDELKTRVLPQDIKVYELPPKISPINPAIEIGDFFKISASIAGSTSLTWFLVAVIILLILLNIQLRIQRKKAREKIIDDILKK